MKGKFEIYKDKAEQFRFRLKASNGQNILASQGYKTKSGCINGIESVKKNAQIENRFQKTETKAGKFAFNLSAANRQVIGKSQQYGSPSSRDKGIKSVMNNAPEADIFEV